jgi:hypothetical protein
MSEGIQSTVTSTVLTILWQAVHFAETLLLQDDLELRKKLVKCYIWSTTLYGVETWTLRAVDQKHLESSEMWCWRRMEKISWTDHVRNEAVLLRVKKQRNILHDVNGRRTGLVTFCVETAFYNGLLKER